MACRPSPPAASRSSAEPRIRATVITIETKLQPQNQTLRHEIVIADGRARSTDDVDSWRLFDLRQKQVTFVDDVAKTQRAMPFAALVEERRKELARPLHPTQPHAEYAATGAKRVLLGVEAAEHRIRLGGYQRQLWIAKHPAIPDELFAMMQASTRPPNEALMSVQGFPLVDRAELTYGSKKMIVERSVVKIEQREVPASLLEIKAPAARPRSAS